MATVAKRQRIKIVTPEFRVSYPQVFEAKKINESDVNEKAKFSIQMLFRVAETEGSKKLGEKVVKIDELKGAVRKVLFDKFGEEWKAKVDELKIRLPFRSGSERKDKDGYDDGVVFVNSSSQQKPGLVDPQLKPILDRNEFYGGCYARAELNPYWYDRMGNKGVSFGLQNIQKVRDGEPFSGKTKPEDAFDAIEAPEGAAPAAGGAVEQGDPLGL